MTYIIIISSLLHAITSYLCVCWCSLSHLNNYVYLILHRCYPCKAIRRYNVCYYLGTFQYAGGSMLIVFFNCLVFDFSQSSYDTYWVQMEHTYSDFCSFSMYILVQPMVVCSCIESYISDVISSLFRALF